MSVEMHELSDEYTELLSGVRESRHGRRPALTDEQEQRLQSIRDLEDQLWTALDEFIAGRSLVMIREDEWDDYWGTRRAPSGQEVDLRNPRAEHHFRSGIVVTEVLFEDDPYFIVDLG